jgi:hypothetical protein
MEMKPCPFCGSKVNVNNGDIIIMPIFMFKCTNPKCGATITFNNMEANKTPAKAIQNFNSRIK